MASALILIVEDNPKNLKLIRDVLQYRGYTTLEAQTGEVGVELARQRQPTLILMDAHSDHCHDGVCHERRQRTFTDGGV
jgi:CheY-like chemotaxis protein